MQRFYEEFDWQCHPGNAKIRPIAAHPCPDVIMAIRDMVKTHRTWEDGVGLVLGLMIGLSPWFYEEPVVPAVVFNAGLTGLAVLALAQLEIVRWRRWEEFAQLACGLWLFASPLIFHCAHRTICGSGMGTRRERFFAGGLGALADWDRPTLPNESDSEGRRNRQLCRPATIGMRAARMAGNNPPTRPTINASSTPCRIRLGLSWKLNTTCVKLALSVAVLNPSNTR